MDSKEKDTAKLRGERFLCEMAFLCDITSHLNAMNLQLQGADFRHQFADFEAHKSRFELFSNPFAVDMERSPPNLQMKLIDHQCNDALRAKYAAVGAVEFASLLPDIMPQLRIRAAQTLSMFGGTYLTPNIDELVEKIRHHNVSA